MATKKHKSHKMGTEFFNYGWGRTPESVTRISRMVTNLEWTQKVTQGTKKRDFLTADGLRLTQMGKGWEFFTANHAKYRTGFANKNGHEEAQNSQKEDGIFARRTRRITQMGNGKFNAKSQGRKDAKQNLTRRGTRRRRWRWRRVLCCRTGHDDPGRCPGLYYFTASGLLRCARERRWPSRVVGCVAEIGDARRGSPRFRLR